MSDKLPFSKTYETEILSAKKVDEIKKPTEDDFGSCAGGRASKFHHALAVRRNGKRTEVFEYTHFWTKYSGDNERLDLVFGGEDKWIVIVHGLRLEQLLMAIKERKIDWIKEAPGNSAKFPPDDGKAFISKIDVKPIADKEEELE